MWEGGARGRGSFKDGGVRSADPAREPQKKTDSVCGGRRNIHVCRQILNVEHNTPTLGRRQLHEESGAADKCNRHGEIPTTSQPDSSKAPPEACRDISDCPLPRGENFRILNTAESSFSEEEEEKLQAAFSLEKQELHLVLETISFVLEQAVYHNVKPAALQQQLETIHLTKDKAEAFASAWSAMGQETVEKFRQRILGPHKLETVGWQLNLQMAHSAQAKLQSPQAVLQLGVSKEDAKNVEKVLVEFNHKELFDFYNKLETIQAQLDSLT